MRLNDDFKKLSDNLKINKDRVGINIVKNLVFLHLGIRVTLIFLFFIFIGKLFSKYFDFNKTMVIFIFFATISSIFIVVDVIKGVKK